MDNNFVYFRNGIFWIMLFFTACAVYVYYVNARRPSDDPKKRDFHFGAILLAPITWPFFLLGFITLFVIKALLYMVFLILFTIALVAIRKPFLFIWLDKIATKIGNKLLEANTFLIRIMVGKPIGNPQAI